MLSLKVTKQSNTPIYPIIRHCTTVLNSPFRWHDFRKLPTDIRVKQLQQGFTDDASSKYVVQLSRYLLISLPPGNITLNLQGVWNTLKSTEMVTSKAISIFRRCVLGLRAYPTSGVRRGLSGMDRRFGRTGRKTAGEYCGTKGWVSHTPPETSGEGTVPVTISYGDFIRQEPGIAGICGTLCFRRRQILSWNQGYPIMKAAAEFWLEIW